MCGLCWEGNGEGIMISLKGHILTNLAMNCVLAACLGATLALDLFSFLGFKVGVFTITHRLKYEDVSGDVYSTFSDFESFACPFSQDPGIVAICSNILNFRIASTAYLVLAGILFASILVAVLNLVMILFHHPNAIMRFWYPHLVNVPVYILAAGELLLVSNVDHMESVSTLQLNIETEYGIPMLFITAAVAIITLFHYLFIRKYRNLKSLEESAITLVSRFLASPASESSSYPMGTEAALQSQIAELTARLRAAQEQISELTCGKTGEAESIPSMFPPNKVRQAAERQEDDIDVVPAPESLDPFFESGNPITESRDEISDMKQKIESLLGQLDRANSEKATVEASLETTERKLEEEQQSNLVGKRTIEELLARNEQLMAEVANQQGVEQLKRLLEEEKQQELERQRALFQQQIASRDADITDQRAQIESLKRETARKEDRLNEAAAKLTTTESNLKTVETELQDLKDKMKAIEASNQSLQKLKIDLELHISSLTTELSTEQEKFKHLDDLHKKTLVEMGQASSSQLESLKKMYEDNLQRDLKSLHENDSSRDKKLQGDLAKALSDLAKAQETISQLEQEVRAKGKTVSDLDSEGKRTKTQVDTLTLHLAHAESESSKNAEMLAGANRKVQELLDEVASLHTSLKSQEDLRVKMMAELENRRETDRDRLKAFYEESHSKELKELKDFYEQKVTKLTGDLVVERGQRAESLETADRAVRDKDVAVTDLALLNDQYIAQKLALESLQTTYITIEARLQETLVQFNRIKSENELIRSKGGEANPQLIADLQAAKLRAEEQQREIDDLSRLLEALKSQSDIEIMSEIEHLRESLREQSTENANISAKSQAQIEVIGKLAAEIEDLKANLKDADQKYSERQAPGPDSASVAAKLERKRAKVKSLRAEMEAMGKEKAKQMADLAETYRVEGDRLKEIYMKAFQEQKDDVIKMYEGMVNSLKTEREKLRTETESQASTISELSSTSSKLKKELEQTGAEKESEIEVRVRIYKQYQELKTLYEQRESELSELNHLLDSLRNSSGSKDLLPYLETQVKDLTVSKTQLTKDLDLVQRERDDLRQELTLKDSELLALKDEYMQVHREFLQGKQRGSGGIVWTEDKSHSSAYSMKETMVIEGLAGKAGPNPILEKIANMRRESPMTYSNVWKMFETMMMEKTKLDRMELSAGRGVRSVKDFMLDFVYMQYGLKTLALKHLKALVVSLQDLYKADHPYGTLFARFLGLFHPRPLPDALAAYLLAVQEQFSALIKERTSDTFAETYDIMQYGGQISIVDAMELVIRLCQTNRDAGERIISQLLPSEEESRVDLTLTKVCGTLARMGKESDYVFEMLDRDKGGFVDYHEFVDGIRVTLNIWVTQDEAEDLCAFINDRGTGDVSREEWSQKVDFSAYAQKAQSKDRMVTKCAFLSSLIDEFDREVVQDYYLVRNMIKKPLVDAKTAFELLRRVEPLIDERTASQLYEEAKEFDRDTQGGVSPEALSVVILRNRVGGLGVGIFGNHYTDVKGLEFFSLTESDVMEGRRTIG